MARLTNPAVARLSPDMRMALQIGPTTEDAFSDDDLRVAWEFHRETLLAAEALGKRPWRWWAFEAGRPEHLTPYPLHREGTVLEQAEELEEWQIAPYVFLARHGHLRNEEIAALAEKANEARIRVGTTAERLGSGGVDRADRLAVKLYEAVCEAARRNESAR